MSKDSLTRILHNVIPHAEAGRSLYTLHSSDVTKPDFCPREYYLRASNDIKPDGQYINTASTITFAYGNFMSSYMRNVWLRGYAVGDWECVNCGREEYFCKDPNPRNADKCVNRGPCNFAYKELHITLESSRVSSSLDIALDIGEALPIVVELKTMGKKEFDGLKAPLTEHLVRSILYLHNIKSSEYKDRLNTDELILMYTCKGFGSKNTDVRDYNPKDGLFSPFKEFRVKYNHSIVEPYLKIVDSIDIAFSGGNPPIKICPTVGCQRAESCGVVDLCFGIKEVTIASHKERKTRKKTQPSPPKP